MNLPLCVRVNPSDSNSAASLVADGWRYIGLLDHYVGAFEGEDKGASYGPISPEIIMAVEMFGFSGRIWRDPKIPRFMAVEETRKYLDCEGFMLNDGFGIFTQNEEMLTINLIGVLTPKKGTATDIIKTAAHYHNTELLEAGTFSDNLAAQSLYRSLGMARLWSTGIYHK